MDIKDILKNSEIRWARFGPYYAMFPIDFAFEVIRKYSKKGDFILDPFAGRGSSIFAGGTLGRYGLGVEINPVGWLYGAVKLRPASKNDVLKRLSDIYSKRNYYKRAIERMPLFYRMCYCDEVLKFLLSARKNLDWRNNQVDATLMSILVVYLHGKLGEGLSNQMRMTKAMGVNYSINWWKKHKLSSPPDINPFDFITKKLDWRYKNGTPNISDSRIIFGDSTVELKKMIKKTRSTGKRFSLLFTSPPYCAVTDYYADQWLRLWLLGGSVMPKPMQEKHKGRFVCKEDYHDLLDRTFGDCALLMSKKNVVYIRTDRRKFTFDTTLSVLKKHFPHHKIEINDKPFTKKTQTDLFRNFSSEGGEIDIVMTLS